MCSDFYIKTIISMSFATTAVVVGLEWRCQPMDLHRCCVLGKPPLALHQRAGQPLTSNCRSCNFTSICSWHRPGHKACASLLSILIRLPALDTAHISETLYVTSACVLTQLSQTYSTGRTTLLRSCAWTLRDSVTLADRLGQHQLRTHHCQLGF